MEDIMKRETIFTKIIRGQIPSYKIYEDENTYAFLDIGPFAKGHTLVVPKIPYEKISEMKEEDYLNLQKTVLRLVKHYEQILNCRMGTLVFGLDVPHAHIHIFPINSELKLFDFTKIYKYSDKEAENYKKQLELNLL